jgi:hypothetical protein
VGLTNVKLITEGSKMGLKHSICFICLILLSLSLYNNSAVAEYIVEPASDVTSTPASDVVSTSASDDVSTVVTSHNILNNGINISLLSQDPDPVKPGDILEVRLSVENTGFNDIEDCFLEIKPEYPFKALDGEKTVENLGTLVKRSEGERKKSCEVKARNR